MNADGAAILDTEVGQITTLNPTGAMVWQSLRRGESLDRVAVDIARETGEEIEAVKSDLKDFIEELRKKNLLSR
jgi:Coenzyme PQQ synthesis protein D (PqqD).